MQLKESAIAILRTFLPQGRFLRAVTLVASGTAISQLVSVLVTPLLTRMVAPEAFGVLSAYVALLMMIKTVVGMRYEMAIPLAATERDAVVMLLVTLTVVLLFSLAAVGLAASFKGQLPHIVRLSPLSGVIWLLPVGVLFMGTYQSLTFWALRNRAYRDIAATTVAQGLGRGLTQLGATLVRASAEALVIGEIIGQGAGVVRLGRSAVQRTRDYWAGISFAELRDAARRHAAFPMMQAPASFLNGAGMQLPTLLIATLYGTNVAGWYFLTQRLLGMPIQFLSGAMSQVFIAEAAELAKSDPAALDRTFNSIARKLLLVGALPTAALIFFGPWAMETFLGRGWAESGVYLQWLSVSFLLKFSLDGLINLAIVEHHFYSLSWAVIRLVMACAAVLGSFYFGLSATYCVAWLGLALALGYLLKLWYWRRALAQLQGVVR